MNRNLAEYILKNGSANNDWILFPAAKGDKCIGRGIEDETGVTDLFAASAAAAIAAIFVPDDVTGYPAPSR